MARDMPDGLKRYDVEEKTRAGSTIVTTYKLNDAEARRRGLLPAEEAKPAESKKRAAPTGRARKGDEAGSKSGDDEG